MQLALHKLAAAKLWLISAPPNSLAEDGPRDLPYLSHALYALIPVANERIATMTCDEWWHVYINPAWLDTAGIPEIGAQLAHITWHLLHDHASRARDTGVDASSAREWTTATDVTIAHTLAPEAVCPPELPTAESEGLPRGRSAEEYFAQLSALPAEGGGAEDDEEPSHEGCGSGADGQRRSSDLPPDSDLGGVDRFGAQEIRRTVAIEFRNHVTQRGTDPGDALRWVKNVLEPDIPWIPMLTAAVRRAVGWAAGRGDFTYQRPSRRAASVPGIILAGQHRPIPRIAIIVDTSASVDDQLLALALGEVDGVIGALSIPGGNVTLYSVDAAVHTTQRVRSAKDAKLVGAGGTDLRIGLAAIEDERPRPDIIIVFTDGDTPWPTSPPPGATTIVAVLGRKGDALPATPDWAVRIECILRDRRR